MLKIAVLCSVSFKQAIYKWNKTEDSKNTPWTPSKFSLLEKYASITELKLYSARFLNMQLQLSC